MECRECGGYMGKGVVLQSVITSGGVRGAPARKYDCCGPSGDAVLVAASKCEDCGRTVSQHGRITLTEDGLTGD
jgi:hypothetical protein